MAFVFADNPNGRSVSSLQQYLRTIGKEYREVLPVVPDGIFGPQTTQSVISFQNQFGMEPTGVVDSDTWDRILGVYDDIVERAAAPNHIDPFPAGHYVLELGTEGDEVAFVQIMLCALAGRYANLSRLEITGVYDVATMREVRIFQPIGGLEATGKVDKRTWNALTRVYQSVRLDEARLA